MAACGGAVAHCGLYGGGCCCDCAGLPVNPLCIGMPVNPLCIGMPDWAGGIAYCGGGCCCCCAGIVGVPDCSEPAAHCERGGGCCMGGALNPLGIVLSRGWAGDRLAPFTMRALGVELGVGGAPGAGGAVVHKNPPELLHRQVRGYFLPLRFIIVV